jgi:phosphoribosylamine--glycine ligase
MRILVLGSGGREHTLAWKIAQSPKLEKLFIAPGNAGTDSLGENVNLNISNFGEIKTFVLKENVTMVLVGPEAPLVDGVHDFFLADDSLKNIPVIGPKKDGATLEGSKDFAKKFMMRHNIPTAAYYSYTKDQVEEAVSCLDKFEAPYVLKADGLAAGKGVLILDDKDEAAKELTSMLQDAKFGEASNTVVIEQFLSGIELSVFVLTDGESYKILPSAKDYKRIGEGDTGLNTGGMGSISPVPFADDDFMAKVEERIVIPTVEGLKKDEIDYQGFIFIGLMNVEGDPFVIEYNVRMGDPETESVIPRIKSDLVDLLEGVANRNLNEKSFEIDERIAASVMLVSGGYPESYAKGKVMSNLDKTEGSILFHAGTKRDGDEVLTNGGRVIAITTLANSMEEALEVSFNNAELIDYEGKYYRKDIGKDLK